MTKTFDEAVDIKGAATIRGAVTLTSALPIAQGGTGQTTAPAALAALGGVAAVVTINNQTGTTYTLVLGDANAWVELNNAASIALTIPPNSSVAIPIGSTTEIYQMGAGVITVTAGAGVTLRAPHGAKSNGQYSVLSVFKRATDEWVVLGDTTA